jgi:1-aminocyclopropane-1-carboxylate deaminase
LHPLISGNKFRKLKYNLIQAEKEGHETLLSFGGAFSNHIAAVARAGREFGFRTIGIIRGEELEANPLANPTLGRAIQDGMQLKFISRKDYREKTESGFQETLCREYGRFYLLPEGGTNALAVKGCEEILKEEDRQYNVICCSTGTGGTLAGIINSSDNRQKVIGFPALKGDFIKKDICSFVSKSNWYLENGYHFGGYAKINETLVAFINNFHLVTGVPLDPVYTGKMFYGLLDMVRREKFKRGSSILAIHSGGLQGTEGMNRKLEQKKLPLINL